jgi:hypothetical protein
MPGSGLTYAIADPVAPLYFLNLPLSAVNTSTDIIDLGTAHNFITGNCIWFLFTTTGAGLVNSGGLSALRKYFVIVVTSNTIKLASTLSDASNGVAIDITSFATNAAGFHFGKTSNFPNIGPLGAVSPEFFPAYAKSNNIFNSSIPVEINFTIPAYTALSNTNFITPMVALLRQEGAMNCYGLAIRIQNIAFLFNGGVDSNYGVAVPAGNVSGVGTALTAGYKQKYVITPSRTIEYWYGAINSTMSLFFTSTALPANTNLRLEFGSNFTFCKVQDCTIKYL